MVQRRYINVAVTHSLFSGFFVLTLQNFPSNMKVHMSYALHHFQREKLQQQQKLTWKESNQKYSEEQISKVINHGSSQLVSSPKRITIHLQANSTIQGHQLFLQFSFLFFFPPYEMPSAVQAAIVRGKDSHLPVYEEFSHWFQHWPQRHCWHLFSLTQTSAL